MATIAPVLGTASWFRGKMQADPSIPTISLEAELLDGVRQPIDPITVRCNR